MSTSVERAAGANAPDIRATGSGSLAARARHRDVAAITTMFQQFLPSDEHVIAVDYLGSIGLLFRTRSFACVTDRRVASLQLKSFRQIIYQDGLIESINSGVLYQPSWLSRTLDIITLGLFSRLSHRQSGAKVGLVLAIREGVNVYILSHRNDVLRANAIYRAAMAQRASQPSLVR